MYSLSLGYVFIYPTNIYQMSTMYLPGTGLGAGGTELRVLPPPKPWSEHHEMGIVTDYLKEAQLNEMPKVKALSPEPATG